MEGAGRIDDIIGTVIQHSDFGDPDCCGCFCAVVYGDVAYLTCNECGSVIRTISVSQLRQTLDAMEPVFQ